MRQQAQSKLTAAQIRAAIVDADRELEIARAEERTAVLRAGQARARATLGHGADLGTAEAALAAAEKQVAEIAAKRASLDVLLPEAGFEELIARREELHAKITTDTAELARVSARVREIKSELEVLEPRERVLRAFVNSASLGSITQRIAEYVDANREALIAAGVALPGAEKRVSIEDIQGVSPFANQPFAEPRGGTLADIQRPAPLLTVTA